jgi:hypothetical protein
MDNQNFKGMISALEKVSNDNSRITGSLLDELNWLTDKVFEIIKQNDLHDNKSRFDFNGYGYRTYTFNWIVDVNSGDKLPSSIKEIGNQGFMNKEEILHFCNHITGFVKNIISVIQSLTSWEEKALETISKIQITE